MRLSIVVPAYREADRIANTVADLRTVLGPIHECGGVEIVVVDDGSDDNTAAAARAAGADAVVRLPMNRGKGAAVRAGLVASSGSVVVFTDADLAYPPHQIARLLADAEAGADVVIGDRRHPESVATNRQALLRRVGSQFAVTIARRILGVGTRFDTQCGLKALRRDAALELVENCVVDKFAFDVELLHLATRWRLRVSEVPVEVVNSNVSTVRPMRDGLRLVLDMGRIRARTLLGCYPARQRN